MGRSLQRLFSTFPNSWPGLGLLLLRTCLGIALIVLGIAGMAGKPQDFISLAPYLISDVGGVLILAGLWTPVMGTVVVLNQIWIASLFYSLQREDAWMHIFLAVVAASVAMLGPGAWSIDAHLFGRKRF